MDIEQSQREFMQAVDRSVAKHDEMTRLSDWKTIEANETAFERRVTWAVCAVIVGLSAYAFFR